jgi:hypothetical protein
MSGSPRAFEPQRLLQPLRAHARAWAGLAIVALFAGAAIARFAIPNELVASGALRVSRDAHLAVTAVRAPDLLEQARARAGVATPARELREQLRVTFRAPDRVQLDLRADGDEQRSRALLDSLLTTYLERVRAQTDSARRAAEQERELAAGKLRRALGKARAELGAAQVRTGFPDLQRALAETRALLAGAEAELQRVEARVAEAQGKHEVVESVRREPEAQAASAQLAEAQRNLSRLLAQHGDRKHPDVLAAEQRLAQLQAATVHVTNSALRQRLEAQTLAARAREQVERVASVRAELARLESLRLSLAPLIEAEERAASALAQHEAEALAPLPAVVSISERASVRRENRTALRTLASLLVPIITLLSLFVFVVLRELRSFRVCAPTELAYWLRAPVLASSSWPRQHDALEGLVDELASPAVAARGIVLVLPLTELERPLAATLAAQLNSRAQRQFRSSTGSRVTIAQPWLGELGGARAKRAAVAADRVLWVVAADSHGGREVRRCAALLERRDRIAAVLVDAEPTFGPAVGSAREFWTARPVDPALVGAQTAAQ